VPGALSDCLGLNEEERVEEEDDLGIEKTE